MTVKRRERVERKAARGSAAGVFSQGLYLAVRFFLTPFTIAAAGLEAYGFWSVLFVTLGCLGIHRMGILGASVALVAKHHEEGDLRGVERILRGTSTLVLGFSFSFGVPLVVFAPEFIAFLGPSPGLVESATWAFRTTLTATLLSMMFGGYQTLLEGLQEHPRVKLIEGAVSLLEAVLIVGLLTMGWGLYGLAVAYAARLLLPVPVFALFCRRLSPGISALPGPLDRELARSLLGFGGSVQLLGGLHLAICALERIVLARGLSLVAVGSYELARKLVSFAASLPTHALQPLIPATARLHAGAAEPSDFGEILRTNLRLVAALASMPLSILLAAAPEVLWAWTGDPRPEVATVLRILILAAYVHLVTGPMTAALRGLLRPRLELGYTALWLGLAAITIPLATRVGGLPAIALAAAVSQALSSGVFLGLALPRLGLSRRILVRDAVLPLLTWLPLFVVTCGVRSVFGVESRGDAVSFVFLAGALGSVLVAPALFFGVFDRRERKALTGWMSRIPGIAKRARISDSNRAGLPREARAHSGIRRSDSTWLSIVIVTYRCKEAIQACLDSLERALPGVAAPTEVIVIDSKSEDGTAELVGARFPWVRLRILEENRGFAVGCNRGFRLVRGERILFLNPDTVVAPRTLEVLLDYLEDHPRAAAVGPRLIDRAGTPQVSTQSFPSLLQTFARQWSPLAKRLGLNDLGDRPRDRAGRVDWISGACFMTRKRAFSEIGGLDERFFLYFEETDWCRRASRIGWEIHHEPSLAVTHGGGECVASSEDAEPDRPHPHHYAHSRRRYFRKHYGPLYAGLVEGLYWVRLLVAKLRAVGLSGGWR